MRSRVSRVGLPWPDSMRLSVAVYKIDIDENPEVAQQYGVMSIPTFIAFKDGAPVKKTLGAQPKEKILELLA